MAVINLEWREQGADSLRRTFRTITQDANSFQRTVARAGVAFDSVADAVRRLGQQRIVLQADVSRVNASLATVRAQIQRAQQQRINIEANAQAFNAELNRIDADLARTRELQLNVDADTDEFTRLEAQIRRLEARRITVQGRIDGVGPELNRIDARLQSLSDKEIKVTADAEQANRSLNQLDGILQRLDGDEAAAELDRLNRQLRETSTAADRPSRSLRGFNSVLAGFSAGAAAAAISGLTSALRGLLGIPARLTQEFLEFDRALNQASVISGAAATPEFAALTEEIERLGIVTSATPAQLAEAATALSRAGFSAEQTAQALEGVVRGAEASGSGILETGDIVARALRAFNIPAEQSLALTNAFVATANSTNTTLNSLGESFNFAAAQAARSNQPIDDTLVLLGLLGDAGIQGSAAGTNLAAALQRLQIASAANASSFPELVRGSARTAEAFNQIGVEVRNSDGSMRSLLEVLPVIQGNLNELSQQDQDILLKALFGVEGGRAFGTLLNAAPERIAAVTNEVTNLAQEGAGAATRASEEILNSLSGSFELLGGSISTLNNQLAAAFAPALQAGVEGITAILNEIIATEGVFEALNNSAEEFAVFLAENPIIVQDIANALTDVLEIVSELTGGVLAEITETLERNPGLIRDTADSFVTLTSAVANILGTLIGVADRAVQVQRAIIGFIDAAREIPVIGDAFLVILAVLRGAIDPINTLIARIDAVGDAINRIRGISDAIEVNIATDTLTEAQSGLNAFGERLQELSGENAFEGFVQGSNEANAAIQSAAEDTTQQLEAEEEQRLESLRRSFDEQRTLIEANTQDRARTRITLEQELLSSGTDETVIRATLELRGIDDARAELQEQLALESQRREQFADGTDERANAIAEIDRLQTALDQNTLDRQRAIRVLQQAAEDAHIEAIQREGEEAEQSFNAQAQAQELFFNQQIRSAESSARAFDLATESLDAQNSALERRGQLIQAQSSLQGALDNSEVKGLERALEIRQRLNSEEELSATERRALENELQALTGSRNASEQRIQRELLAAEQQRSENRINALAAQQAVERASLLLDQNREQLAAQRAVIEADIAAIQARAARAALAADQARLQIQERSLQSQLAVETDPEARADLQSAIVANQQGQQAGAAAIAAADGEIAAQEQVAELRRQELEDLAAIQEQQRVQLTLQQQLAEFQLLQSEATDARARATDAAIEGSNSLAAAARQDAIELERARDASQQLAENLLAASQNSSNVSIPTLTPRREGGPVTPSGGPYLVGEAPNVGPELGVFNGKAQLFTQPTILNPRTSGRIYSPEQTARIFSQVNPEIASQLIPQSLSILPNLAPATMPSIMVQGGQGMSTAAMESELSHQSKLLSDIYEQNLKQSKTQRLKNLRGY